MLGRMADKLADVIGMSPASNFSSPLFTPEQKIDLWHLNPEQWTTHILVK